MCIRDSRITIHKHYYTPVAGKRNGIRVAMEHINPNSDITVLVDSDTVWTEDTLSELLKPFACDQKIGGVTTRQKILCLLYTSVRRSAFYACQNALS